MNGHGGSHIREFHEAGDAAASPVHLDLSKTRLAAEYPAELVLISLCSSEERHTVKISFTGGVPPHPGLSSLALVSRVVGDAAHHIS